MKDLDRAKINNVRNRRILLRRQTLFSGYLLNKKILSLPIPIELEELRQRLQEAEETLEAIRSGEVDALVVSGPSGEKVFTLEGAEHPYRVLVESMNEGAISLSLDGTILYCNAAFARLIGCPLDQIMGRDLVEFVPVEEREMLERLIGRGHLDAVRAELTILAAPGRELPTQVSLNPINLEEGPSIAVIVTDLSERKRHQQAEAAVRMRDEFLAIASHELRTPLTTLVLSLGAVEQDRTKGDLKQIQRSLRRHRNRPSAWVICWIACSMFLRWPRENSSWIWPRAI